LFSGVVCSHIVLLGMSRTDSRQCSRPCRSAYSHSCMLRPSSRRSH
jgi:hypothetical protein